MKLSNIFPRHSNYDLPTAIKGEGSIIVTDEDPNIDIDITVSYTHLRAHET